MQHHPTREPSVNTLCINKYLADNVYLCNLLYIVSIAEARKIKIPTITPTPGCVVSVLYHTYAKIY